MVIHFSIHTQFKYSTLRYDRTLCRYVHDYTLFHCTPSPNTRRLRTTVHCVVTYMFIHFYIEQSVQILELRYERTSCRCVHGYTLFHFTPSSNTRRLGTSV